MTEQEPVPVEIPEYSGPMVSQGPPLRPGRTPIVRTPEEEAADD